MKEEISYRDFYCPKCKETAQYNYVIGTRKYSAATLDLPYFMCAVCRLCAYSPLLLIRTIARWRKNFASARKAPWRAIFEESSDILDKVLDYYVRTAGYKRIKKFKRKKIH